MEYKESFLGFSLLPTEYYKIPWVQKDHIHNILFSIHLWSGIVKFSLLFANQREPSAIFFSPCFALNSGFQVQSKLPNTRPWHFSSRHTMRSAEHLLTWVTIHRCREWMDQSVTLSYFFTEINFTYFSKQNFFSLNRDLKALP